MWHEIRFTERMQAVINADISMLTWTSQNMLSIFWVSHQVWTACKCTYIIKPTTHNHPQSINHADTHKKTMQKKKSEISELMPLELQWICPIYLLCVGVWVCAQWGIVSSSTPYFLFFWIPLEASNKSYMKQEITVVMWSMMILVVTDREVKRSW